MYIRTKDDTYGHVACKYFKFLELKDKLYFYENEDAMDNMLLMPVYKTFCNAALARICQKLKLDAHDVAFDYWGWRHMLYEKNVNKLVDTINI